MKIRIIQDKNEITVITEDGGIACIREADDMSPEEPRIAVTDYYQMKITDPSMTSENLFECLAEGKMYHKDWIDVKYNSLTAIEDALAWLCSAETSFEVSDDLFTRLFSEETTSIIPDDYLTKIRSADAFDLLELVLYLLIDFY
jgi:hypothetical protein